jgi:hypothetical protein
MGVAALILSSIIFVEAFFFLRLDRQAKGVFVIARDAMSVLADGRLGDDEKESCARRASRLILKMTAVVVFKLAAIVAVLSGLFLGAAWLFPASAERLFAALTSPLVLGVVALVTVGWAWMRHAIRG